MAGNPARNCNARPNLVLIGMPGAGKSTVGKHLAKVLQMPFLDTDELLASRHNCTLQQLVDRRGIKNFREAERAVVCELRVRSHVIATGGSVVYSDNAMRNLSRHGLIVFLRISLSAVRSRIAASGDRGLAKYPADTIAGLFYQRTPLYQHWADVTVDNNLPLTRVRLDRLARQLSDKLGTGETRHVDES